MYQISVTVGLVLGGLALFLLAFALARRSRARAAAKAGRRAAAPGSEPLVRRVELRLDEIEARIEAQAAAQAAAGSPEDRLRAMAGSLVGLIRDKNATLETALAGLDQLRARLRALEQMGDLAEARGLYERLEARIDELRSAQAAAAAAVEERIAGLKSRAEAEAAPQAALAEQFGQLYAQKDASTAAMLARLAPFEARLAELEGGLEGGRAAETAGREALTRLEARIETLRGGQEAALRDLAALRAEVGAGAAPVVAIAERLSGLHAQKEALVETLLARLTQLEEELAAQDPRAALDRFAERLEAAQAAREAAEAGLRDRVAALETPGENPFAEISEQLTRLYAQKDATVETVFARLAPLEARLAGIEDGLAGQNPQTALDRFAERLEAVQARLSLLETPEANPFAEISEQLTRLYAQKDATVETVFARLAPLEARLAGIEADLTARDPRAALDGFAERLEAAQAAREAAEAGLRDRVAALETPGENPFAEISEQLTRLYAQKDATVETVFARLAPLEARLAEMEAGLAARDPQAALDTFAERLEALRGRLSQLETPGENPFAEIAAQLTALYAQKDAAVETVFARLAPLEARLAGIEDGLAGQNPQAVLDRFAERLEAMQARLSLLETPEANPFAEIAEQLTALYAQKDAAVETVFARLAPLEARLAGIEEGVAGSLPRLAALEAGDPRAALEDLGARMEALRDAQGAAGTRIEALRAALGAAAAAQPFAEIADQLTRLYAQKDAGIAAVLGRLAPLEARLAELEARPAEGGEDEARAEAQAIATQMIAARAAAEQTELFANRLALLEASLPRLSADQARLARALEHRSAPPPASAPSASAPPTSSPSAEAAGTGAGGLAAADLAAIRDLPRVVSLHHK